MKLLGDERKLYKIMRTIAEAHTNAVNYRRLNGFYVAYSEDLNTGNLKAELTSPYFFARAWDGTTLSEMKMDYPFLLVFPPSGRLDNPRNTGFQAFELDLLFLDLYKQAGEGVVGTAGTRTKEDIWGDTNQVGREFIAELAKYSELIEGPRIERIADFMNQRLYGTAFRITIRLQPCDDNPGSFASNLKTLLEAL